MLVRDLERGEAARERIAARLGSADRHESAAQLELWRCDLADLAAVRHFAAALRRRGARLDVLVNNAGAACRSQRQRTDDGFELAFATNVLGPFVLTGLLARAAPPRTSAPA